MSERIVIPQERAKRATVGIYFHHADVGREVREADPTLGALARDDGMKIQSGVLARFTLCWC